MNERVKCVLRPASFLQADRLTDAVSQEVQLSPADDAASLDFNLSRHVDCGSGIFAPRPSPATMRRTENISFAAGSAAADHDAGLKT